ncbi:DUF4845 domain-containing protein [Thauera aromatica]|uniref:Putative membrane protein n=1 Tax=Thauera aromatica K172 TaxID=44139 RepID=A0A2R4BMW4_THAAR|nr:DUF4845 domain-containing protein [Thauera aromatica]AVR88533.1 putative membrane protein [Thauera aromatica K172]MCK2094500.1 DUF4845 domain-containing protein [Thauera aromatica]
MRMKSQRGLSLLGVLVVGAFAAFVLTIGFRTVPVINEYLAIKRIVNVLADEGDKGVPALELRRSFDRRGQIDDVSSVSGVDLLIDKSGPRTRVEVDYSRTVPLVANLSLLIDLHASSEAR